MNKTNVPRLSEEQYEKIEEEICERMQQFTPLPGNLCHNCKGSVVKKVTGWAHGKFQYSLPACNDCNRPYYYAKNVNTTGEGEFLELVNKPFTV